jgi:class 3 adenylate cyclase
MLICPKCSSDNRPGRKFCSRCGGALAQSCPACGAANEAGDAFCGECGAPLGSSARASLAPVAAAAPAGPATPQLASSTERRLVSILFADLVGFTALSEPRDAEEVRELLSRYFEQARLVIGRYGGTLEKFIGDAVMAVWGTPVAHEDDAERAVRAALELVDAVAALGRELGTSDLRLRAGVLTGEAAVTTGAEGQGMVAGDLVNTASRIQSVAEPSSVFVGDATRRASEAAIVYAIRGFRVEGEDGASDAVAGAAGCCGAWRRGARAGARGSVRRPRLGVAALEGACITGRRRR